MFVLPLPARAGTRLVEPDHENEEGGQGGENPGHVKQGDDVTAPRDVKPDPADDLGTAWPIRVDEGIVVALEDVAAALDRSDPVQHDTTEDLAAVPDDVTDLEARRGSKGNEIGSS